MPEDKTDAKIEVKFINIYFLIKLSHSSLIWATEIRDYFPDTAQIRQISELWKSIQITSFFVTRWITDVRFRVTYKKIGD